MAILSDTPGLNGAIVFTFNTGDVRSRIIGALGGGDVSHVAIGAGKQDVVQMLLEATPDGVVLTPAKHYDKPAYRYEVYRPVGLIQQDIEIARGYVMQHLEAPYGYANAAKAGLQSILNAVGIPANFAPSKAAMCATLAVRYLKQMPIHISQHFKDVDGVIHPAALRNIIASLTSSGRFTLIERRN